MSKVNYQEVLDDAVMGCCDTFGAGEGEDAATMALAEARASSAGWTDFLSKFAKSLKERLGLVPKNEIDAKPILDVIGSWFDAIVGPMKFPAWMGAAEAAIKATMKKSLLAVVEFVIATVLGQ